MRTFSTETRENSPEINDLFSGTVFSYGLSHMKESLPTQISNRMMRHILLIVIVISALMLTSADYKTTDVPSAKKFCRGYSVIEADKGIDCHGDTIKLVKVHGFFERELKEPT